MCSIASFSDCHLAFMPEDVSLQIGDSLFDLFQTRFRLFVFFALQCLPLDLQLNGFAFQLIDLLRQRIDLDAQAAKLLRRSGRSLCQAESDQ